MYYTCSILIIAVLHCKYAETFPQPITLDYKPITPSYAAGFQSRPGQIHGPGTPWPASAAGYTKTTTWRPWWATTEAIEANAVSLSSSQNPPARTTTAAATTTTSTTTTTTTTTTPAPPPTTTTTTTPAPPPTTTTRRWTTTSTPSFLGLADVGGSTISTKLPPVPAATEATLFTSAPETAGAAGAAPQGPPRQGSWSRPAMQQTEATPKFPNRISAPSSPAADPALNPADLLLPNNLMNSMKPDAKQVSDSVGASAAAPLPPSSTPLLPQVVSASSTRLPPEVVSSSTTTTTSSPVPPSPSTTVNASPPGKSDSSDLNSRVSRPDSSLNSESQDRPESPWVWEFHEEDGKKFSSKFYEGSAIILDFK